MKHLLRMLMVVVVVGLALAARNANADRADVWSAASVDVYRVDLRKLPDGGCAVRAFATYNLTDGGDSRAEGSGEVEIGGANRTACLDIINTRAPVLFKSNRGL